MFDALNVLTLHHTNDRHDVHIPQCITPVPTRYKQHISPISVQLQTIQNPLHKDTFYSKACFLKRLGFSFLYLNSSCFCEDSTHYHLFCLGNCFLWRILGEGPDYNRNKFRYERALMDSI